MRAYLSPKKQRFVDFIQTFTYTHGCPPTFAEIMDGLHIKSPGTVNWYVKELERAGVLERSKGYSGKRALIINPVIISDDITIPFFESSVAAGGHALESKPAFSQESYYYLFRPRQGRFHDGCCYL